MVDGTSKRSHFRGKPRPDRRINITYRLFTDGALGDEVKAVTKNIGVGGAFILMASPPPSGTTLLVSIPIAADNKLDVKAEVRWVVDATSTAPATEHGAGVRFTALDVDQLLSLNEFFATLPATVDHG